jgi:hypothetical protein
MGYPVERSCVKKSDILLDTYRGGADSIHFLLLKIAFHNRDEKF